MELQEALPPPELPPRPSKFVPPVPRLTRNDSDHSSSDDEGGATVPLIPTNDEDDTLTRRLDSITISSTNRGSMNFEGTTPRHVTDKLLSMSSIKNFCKI